MARPWRRATWVIIRGFQQCHEMTGGFNAQDILTQIKSAVWHFGPCGGMFLLLMLCLPTNMFLAVMVRLQTDQVHAKLVPTCIYILYLWVWEFGNFLSHYSVFQLIDPSHPTHPPSFSSKGMTRRVKKVLLIESFHDAAMSKPYITSWSI